MQSVLNRVGFGEGFGRLVLEFSKVGRVSDGQRKHPEYSTVSSLSMSHFDTLFRVGPDDPHRRESTNGTLIAPFALSQSSLKQAEFSNVS